MMREERKKEEESGRECRERMRVDGRGGIQRKCYNERVTMV